MFVTQLPFNEDSVLETSNSYDHDVSADSGDDLGIVSDVRCVPCSRLRLIHHNVQGLQSKWDDFRECMAGCAASGNIFCYSETWIKPESVLMQIPGFQAFYSPFLRSGSQRKFLPGSYLFASDTLKPEHPPLCGEIEYP